MLPANALSEKRGDRFATLRAIGLSYRDASLGAAEDRYYTLLAEHVRARLELNRSAEPARRAEPARPEPSADELPSRIRQRFVAPQPPPKTAAQREAERFLRVWYQRSSVADVAQALNRSVKSVKSYVTRLRMLGLTDIRPLPATAGPLVRGALVLVPSVN